MVMLMPRAALDATGRVCAESNDTNPCSRRQLQPAAGLNNGLLCTCASNVAWAWAVDGGQESWPCCRPAISDAVTRHAGTASGSLNATKARVWLGRCIRRQRTPPPLHGLLSEPNTEGSGTLPK
ncbi:hypothetical protein ACJQWK_09320 [Exserohilum turcicum]